MPPSSGAGGYGLYSSLAALGALIGSLLSTLRRSVRLRGLVAAVIAYGTFTALAGLAPALLIFFGALVGLGVSRLLFGVAAESIVQLSTNMAIRGRVMSFYLIVITGGQAVGGVLMGFIAEHLGPAIAFTVAGAFPAGAGITVAIILAVRHQLRLRFSLRPRRFVRIVQVRG